MGRLPHRSLPYAPVKQPSQRDDEEFRSQGVKERKESKGKSKYPISYLLFYFLSTLNNMTPTTTTRYIETVGRRKTASARVRITPAAKNSYVINGKDLAAFFPTKELQAIAIESLTSTKMSQAFTITVLVKGGGANGQAEAIRHGSRAPSSSTIRNARQAEESRLPETRSSRKRAPQVRPQKGPQVSAVG